MTSLTLDWGGYLRFFSILKIKGRSRLKKEKENKFKIQLEKKELVTTPMPNALPLRVNLTILSKTLSIKFYVAVEVDEQWRREECVVDEKERAERKIYIFLGLEIGMKYYK